MIKILALCLLFVAPSVQAAKAKAKPADKPAAQAPKDKSDLTWGNLTALLAAKKNLSVPVGEMFDPPKGAVGRGILVGPPKAADGRSHACTLAVLPEKKEDKPLFFVLSVFQPGFLSGEREDAYFKVGLDGSLQKAVLARVKLDASGKEIASSSAAESHDVNSPRVRAMFQVESDFWLRGMYRSRPAAAPAKP